MKNQPLISVIIPVRELSYYLLFESLPAFARLNYTAFEVILLPNEQKQYDITLLKKYPFLRIIPTGKITRPSEKRNIGVERAKGDLIAFIDDDAFPAANWLSQAAKVIAAQNAAAVCGPGLLPQQADYWEKAVDAMLQTWIGAGGYSYRFAKKGKRPVDDYPSMNFIIKKNWFKKAGGFKGDYWPGEDSKLCEELVYTHRQQILYDPQIVVYHHRRRELRLSLKQHAAYGFHRGAFFAHGDRNSRRLGYLIPTTFFIYLAGMLILTAQALLYPSFRFPLLICAIPFITYSAASIYLLARSLSRTKSVKVSLGAVAALFLTHATYAIMFVIGFLKGLDRKRNIYAPR